MMACDENNTANQKVATLFLAKLGYASDVVANGQEALEALSRTPYDLILMDCQMPEMDGLEATRQIRRLEGSQKHTPVIALTANAMKEDRERCLAAGMDDYISKPLNITQLKDVLEKWCQAIPLREMSSATRSVAKASGPKSSDDERGVGQPVETKSIFAY